MQLLTNESDSKSFAQTISSSNNSTTTSVMNERPKLSMIWVKEYKAEREILVAKWIVND